MSYLDTTSHGNDLLDLQWVSVGREGKVANIRDVRSHVKRRDHDRRRQAKKCTAIKISRDKEVALVKEAASHPSAVKIFPLSRRHSDGRRGNEGRQSWMKRSRSSQDDDGTESTMTTSEPRSVRSRSLPIGIYSQINNMIPYAWFEEHGPVLYVNRLNWPFNVPLNVTGSDRAELTHKSLTPRQSGWTPSIRPSDKMAVRGAVLDAKVLRWIGQSPECFRFRLEVINWIQKQLHDPRTATSNRTMGSIMTFAMWTAGYSNPFEMINHMDAIERIVNIRGGFLLLQDDELIGRKLILFDSMIAVQTGLPPRFPRVDYAYPLPLSPAADQHNIYQESPLFGSGDFKNVINNHQDQERIISVLRELWVLTKDVELQTQESGEILTLPFTPEPRSNYNLPLLTLPLVSECDNSSHTHILETIQSAGRIYRRVLTGSTIDFPSPCNNNAFLELCTALGKCSHAEFWVRYPGILLWVLLVGTATARAKEEAAFWMFYLSRTGADTSIQGQVAGSRAISTFLNIQSCIKQRNK